MTRVFNLRRIPAFSDNYLWLLDNGESALAVDPGDAEPIIEQLEAHQLSLDYILTTHHHPDHIGGIETLQSLYQTEVIGPNSRYIPQATRHVNNGDQLSLLGLNIDVLTVPGHTLDHIAYFIAAPNPLGSPLLFCGDTLFAGGCGRVFEGTFAQMRESLAKLRELPAETQIHCAHEYTQANLTFALAVEPGNQALVERAEQVAALRNSKQPTVPSTLALELATNPFLRYDADPVIAAAMQRKNASDRAQFGADDVFAAIREWKDNF